MLKEIAKYLGNCKFWISTDKKEIEVDGAVISYGPVIQGSVKTTDADVTIGFDNPLPSGSKSFLLGITGTVHFDKVVLTEEKIVAFAGNKKFTYKRVEE